jgi:drug/metabolite transporter (DMT)-like permease
VGIFSAGGYVFQFTGQKYTLAGRASLFINMYVLWIPFLLYFLKKQKFKKTGILALILSLAGLFFLFYRNFGTFEINYLKGDFLTLLSSFSWTFYIIFAKKLLEKINPLEFSAIVIFLTTIFLFPFLFIDFKLPHNFQGYYGVFHLAFFCTFLAYFLYHLGLSKTHEFTSSLFLLLEVLFAVILSFIFLNEKFTVIQITGSILILSGIFLGAKED